MMNQLMAFWQAQSERDRNIAFIVAAILAVVIYYFVIWQSLHLTVMNLHNDIRENQDLLVLIERVQTKMSQDKTMDISSKHGSNQSLLSVAEQEIAQQQLGTSVKEIKQIGENSVQIQFKEIEYNNLIQWLDKMQINKVVVSKLTVTRSEVAGIVTAEVELSSLVTSSTQDSKKS